MTKNKVSLYLEILVWLVYIFLVAPYLRMSFFLISVVVLAIKSLAFFIATKKRNTIIIGISINVVMILGSILMWYIGPIF
ncbi:hypothetical protein [Bacillus massiliigorillae]|uniref:hypothetical protein n=1 Tax=Bacillus massiliigorillae TaxID=1243664 RepID=UPI0005A5F3C9|nr:hypothetical protein [Bacillus massiliigorillae]